MSLPHPKPFVGVAIVNYQTAALTCRCLGALDSFRNDTHLSVVVVDNCSTDKSVSIIRNYIDENGWNDWIRVIASAQNGGFSYGNNIAFQALLQQGKCDYIWMLNPDTLPLAGACSSLINMLQRSDAIAMVGSRLEDADGTPQISAFNFPSVIGELIETSHLGFLERIFPSKRVCLPVRKQAQQANWLAGASIMFKPKLLEDVGYMDEEYFLYYEEVDYCRAVNEAGYELWYCPDSRVIHEVGASTGISDTRKAAPRRPKYWFDSRRRYFLKNHGRVSLILANICWLVGHCSWLIRSRFSKEKENFPPYFLWDFIRYSIVSTKASKPHQTPLQLMVHRIKEDWVANGKDWTKPGFRAIAVHRFGNFRMSIKHKIFRAPLSLLYRVMYRRVRNVYGIELPYTVKLGRRVIIEHQGCVVIHGYARIGDDCIIRQGVTIGNRYLDRPLEAPTLCKSVNIGAGAKILGGIVIGPESSIGANAVVLKNVPAGVTMAGIPAYAVYTKKSIYAV